jgi:hypothetical protein
MVIVNKQGYLARKHSFGARGHKGKNCTSRDWWLVQGQPLSKNGRVNIKYVSFPQEMIGKHIKFKVEVVNLPLKRCECRGHILVSKKDSTTAMCDKCGIVYKLQGEIIKPKNGVPK